LQPVLFEVFGFPISPYGLLIAVGMLLAVWIGKRRAEQIGIPGEAVIDVTFWGVIAGFLGARVLFILTNFEGFLRDPAFYLFSRSGFVFLGGLIAAVPVVWLVIRKWQVRFWPMADILAPPLALAHGFGRVGCFFAGCCYGKPTAASIGVEFPRVIDWRGDPLPLETVHLADPGVVYKIPSGTRTLTEADIVGHVTGSPAYLEQVDHGVCTWHDAHAQALHPVQLYDAGLQFTLFSLLMVLWSWRRFHGQIFLLYLWLYPLMRIFVEIYRGDADRGLWWLGLSTSQWISAGLLGIALVLTARVHHIFPPATSPTRLSTPPAEPEPPPRK
jgi:phosphatidylglycerol:prolipoprotein diacylglycerol transferase